MRRFIAGLLLGVIGSLSISLGLIATVLVFALVLLAGVAIRSFAILSGALIGWGLAWSAFFYMSFGLTLCNGPGCGSGGEYLNFVLLALGILAAGVVVGVVGWLRTTRDRRSVKAVQ